MPDLRERDRAVHLALSVAPWVGLTEELVADVRRSLPRPGWSLACFLDPSQFEIIARLG